MEIVLGVELFTIRRKLVLFFDDFGEIGDGVYPAKGIARPVIQNGGGLQGMYQGAVFSLDQTLVLV